MIYDWIKMKESKRPNQNTKRETRTKIKQQKKDCKTFFSKLCLKPIRLIWWILKPWKQKEKEKEKLKKKKWRNKNKKLWIFFIVFLNEFIEFLKLFSNFLVILFLLLGIHYIWMENNWIIIKILFPFHFSCFFLFIFSFSLFFFSFCFISDVFSCKNSVLANLTIWFIDWLIKLNIKE